MIPHIRAAIVPAPGFHTMSTFANDAVGLALAGVGALAAVFLRQANRRSNSSFWARNEMATLLGTTGAVASFSLGVGLLLRAYL